MSKILKKSTSLLLTVIMMLSVFAVMPVTAGAATTDKISTSATSGDFEYEILDDGTAEITEYTGSATELEIPGTIDGYTVTSIGYEAFYSCTSLESVTIPNSVTSIGWDAFYRCTSLKSITIPDSVTSIGDYAFECCTSLKSITIPDNITSIGSSAFDDTAWYNNQPDGVIYAGKVACDYKGEMPENTSIVLEDGTLGISGSAFSGCTNLASITIPNSVTSIGDYAFSGCTSLASITIGNGVTSIGACAFSRCESLTSIEIPNEVSELDIWTFSNCTSLKEVTIPASCYIKNNDCFEGTYPSRIIFSSGNGYFAENNFEGINGSIHTIGLPCDCYDRSSIEEITLEEGIQNISNGLFSGCNNLKTIHLPNSLTEIGDYAFANCRSLENILLPDNLKKIGIGAFAKSGLTEVSLPENIIDIGAATFYNCEFLRTADIGNSANTLKSISAQDDENVAYFLSEYGDNKFWDSSYGFFEGCSNLSCVILSECLEDIGELSFANCISLESISLPETITSIGSMSFFGCTSMLSVVVPNNTQDIGAMAFGYGTEKNQDFIIYGKEKSVAHDYANKNAFVFLPDIPNEITARGICNENVVWEFYEKTGTLVIDGDGSLYYSGQSTTPYTYPWNEYISEIKTIEIGKEIDTLAYGCLFMGHEALEEVYIYGNIHQIPKSTFSGCRNLKKVILPNTVSYIDEGCFAECEELIDINLETVEYIGDSGFYNCKKLVRVTLENISYIGYGTFKNCSSLKTIHLPNTLNSISGNYMYGGAFENCISLESITIPDSVTSIGDCAFYGCTSLTSITIPDSVTSIDYGAFSACTSLTNMTIPDSVTDIGSYAFSGCTNLASITIPDSVTSIGRNSFSNCTRLENVYYTGSVSDWSKISFGDYDSRPNYYADNFYILGNLDFSADDNIDEIKDYTFKNCKSLTSITIPDSVTSIGVRAFYNCTSLESITIPDSVTSISYHAFEDCTSLASVTIPDSVTSIGDSAFYDCTNLENAYYNGSVSDWSKISFGNSSSLPNYYADNFYILGYLNFSADDNIDEIKDYTFMNCKSLTSITIPDSVTSIGGSAFEDCTNLTSVTIGNSITSIGNYPFYNCTSLTSIAVGSNNQYYSSLDGNLYNKEQTELIQYAIGKTDEAFVIPDSVTSIGNYAFSGCTSLESVMIPEGVKSIGINAFIGCTSCTSITIPDSVTSIESGAFGYCVYSEVDAEKIPDFKIYGYTGGASETYANENGFEFISIGRSAYATTVTLKEASVVIRTGETYKINATVKYGKGSTRYMSSDSSVAKVSSNGKVTGVGEGTAVITVKNNDVTAELEVTVIAGTATDDEAPITNPTENESNGFKYIVLSDGTAEITGYTERQYDLVIPNTLDGYTVTSIGKKAFYNCTSLMSVAILDNVTSIGDSAFENCEDLSEVFISDNVKIIGDRAFGYIDGEIPDYFKIYGYEDSAAETYANENGITFKAMGTYEYTVLEDGTAEITEYITYPFRYNEDIEIPSQFNEELEIPSETDGYTVTSIGESAFEYYTNLLTVIIPDTVTSVGNRAFAFCNNIKEVTLSDNLKSMGYEAFISCENLKEISLPKSLTDIGECAIGFIFGKAYNTAISDFVIKGYTGTAAETYATENGFEFISLGEAPATNPTATTDPTESTGDITPTESTGGSVSTDPTESSGSTDPTESTQPTDPVVTDPTESTQPTAPIVTDPTESTKATQPATSAKPKTVVKKAKKANPMTVSVKTKKIKAKKLKKAKQTVKAITVSKAKGKVSYAKVKSGTTKKIFKKVTVNKNGKITLKKGKYKKGTYKIKVKITVKGNSAYKSKSKTVTVRIKVK